MDMVTKQQVEHYRPLLMEVYQTANRRADRGLALAAQDAMRLMRGMEQLALSEQIDVLNRASQVVIRHLSPPIDIVDARWHISKDELWLALSHQFSQARQLETAR